MPCLVRGHESAVTSRPTVTEWGLNLHQRISVGVGHGFPVRIINMPRYSPLYLWMDRFWGRMAFMLIRQEWGIRSKWLKNRLSADVSFYSNRDKNLLVKLPVAHEYGYDGQYKQGMEITNRGVELSLAGVLVNQPNDGWQWSVAANFAFNHNELSSLPDGLQQAETDGRLLKVGEAVDRFYVLENNGIYQSDAEVPVKDGRKMTVNGVELKAGDPKWVDKNGDNKITDEDKV